MHVQEKILSNLISTIERSWFREQRWNDQQFLRGCLIRLEHGEAQAWTDFVRYVAENRPLAECVGQLLESWDYVWFDDGWCASPTIAQTPEREQIADLIAVLESVPARAAAPLPTSETRTNKVKSEIMYLEAKPGITGPARIGRVHFSKTGRTAWTRSIRESSISTMMCERSTGAPFVSAPKRWRRSPSDPTASTAADRGRSGSILLPQAAGKPPPVMAPWRSRTPGLNLIVGGITGR